jgi:hypothetical protein
VHEGDAAVRLHRVDHADVREAVVALAVPVAVIGLVEEDDVACARSAAVKRVGAVRGAEEDGHAVVAGLRGQIAQIDPASTVDQLDQAGAVVGHVARNRGHRT